MRRGTSIGSFAAVTRIRECGDAFSTCNQAKSSPAERCGAIVDDTQQLAGLIRGIAKAGDYVVCLGAGNITQWAYSLPEELRGLG